MRSSWVSDESAEPGKHQVSAARLALLERLDTSNRAVFARGRARYRQLRLRHLVGAVPALLVVITTATFLDQVPGLGYGWLDLFGGHGNVATGGGALEVTAQGPSFPWVVLLSTLGLSVLLWFLPTFAENEEEQFRLGAQRRDWAGHVRSCLVFGLIHMVMGVSLGIALALALGGGYFTLCYLRGMRRAEREGVVLRSQYEALEADEAGALGPLVDVRTSTKFHEAAGVAEATRAHLAYNAIIVGGIWAVGMLTLLRYLVLMA